MKRLLKHRPACALLAMLGLLYCSFFAVDLLFPGLGTLSGALKYAGILLCVSLAALLHRYSWNRRDSILLISALSFTALADLFLLLLYLPVPGLLAFFAAHLLHIRRLRPAVFPPAAAVALAAAAGCAAAYALAPGFPLVYALAGLYAVLILTASACSLNAALPRTNRRLAIAGMALFLLCDVHVALFNTLPAENPYWPFASFFMWLFYLPAQALLALSGYGYSGRQA